MIHSFLLFLQIKKITNISVCASVIILKKEDEPFRGTLFLTVEVMPNSSRTSVAELLISDQSLVMSCREEKNFQTIKSSGW